MPIDSANIGGADTSCWAEPSTARSELQFKERWRFIEVDECQPECSLDVESVLRIGGLSGGASGQLRMAVDRYWGGRPWEKSQEKVRDYLRLTVMLLAGKTPNNWSSGYTPELGLQ